MLLLIPLMVYYDIQLSIKIVFLPLILLFNIAFGLAVTFIVASISITKRDLLQVLPYLLNMAIWLTPVFLSSTIFPERFQFIFEFNPIANVIEMWRWVFFDEVEFKFVWAINIFICLVLMLLGFYLYSYRENKFADSI
ncbi:MAG: lipopolysaccharide transport system permease protein [Vicingaceae bacterium]|jgi:lipopolysaccharide transport system permease protein